jgi:thiamine-phosphate pyrophosphorylase
MRSPIDQLSAIARAVHARGRGGRGLPAGLAFSDHARWGDPLALIARLPRGFGFVLRHGGQPALIAQSRAIARICRRRGIKLLIGADIALARRLRADGVHLPERLAGQAHRVPKRWIVTVAWHPATAAAPPNVADAIVMSPVFPSRSPSARLTLGPRLAERAARRVGLPCYALGGVTAKTARGLVSRHWIGLAAIDGFRI